MPLTRLSNNPLITPDMVPPTSRELEVLCTLNPAAVKIDDEYLLLVRVGEKPRVDKPGQVGTVIFDAETGQRRVKYYRLDDPDVEQTDGRGVFHRGKMLLTSMSCLRVARSKDLVNWTFDAKPLVEPVTPWEAFGCEDARICAIDGKYYLTYTAVSELGINVMLAETTDFKSVHRLGIIAHTFNKDVCLFPRRFDDGYCCRHRPYKNEFNDACIWTAWSPDLVHWGRHSVTHRPIPGTWEGERVGAGATPIETDKGWLEVYHASDENGRYCLGVMLSDLDEPDKVIARTTEPVFQPEAPYELTGVFGHCVFSNGLVAEDDGRLIVFYGAADTICAAAETTIDEMIDAAF